MIYIYIYWYRVFTTQRGHNITLRGSGTGASLCSVFKQLSQAPSLSGAANGVGKLIKIHFTAAISTLRTAAKASSAAHCTKLTWLCGSCQRRRSAVAYLMQCADASTAKTAWPPCAKPRLEAPNPQPKSMTNGWELWLNLSTASCTLEALGGIQRRPCRVECRKSHNKGRGECKE